MAVFELFSKRLRRSRGQVADVHVYDEIPQSLKVQIVHIWREAFGPPDVGPWGPVCPVVEVFGKVHNILCKESGRFRLVEEDSDLFASVANYFLRLKSAVEALDVVELTFS